MIDWLTTLLEVTALVSVLAAMTIVLTITYAYVRKYLPKRITEVKVIKKTKKEKPKMSKDTASEGVTFNDIFMFMIAVPLVLLWVGFAGFVIPCGS